MKKMLFIFAILLLFLFGCQDDKDKTFDPTELNIIRTTWDENGNVTSINYVAPSVKDGIKALPYKIKLPKKIPFETDGFKPAFIDDIENNGKKILVTHSAYSKEIFQGNPTVLKIRAYNFDISPPKPKYYDEVELKNGIIGKYHPGDLYFQIGDVEYHIFMMLKGGLEVEQDQKGLIDIANQMVY